MGFTSEGNNRLTEDANSRNKEIQYRVNYLYLIVNIVWTRLFSYDCFTHGCQPRIL